MIADSVVIKRLIDYLIIFYVPSVAVKYLQLSWNVNISVLVCIFNYSTVLCKVKN